MKKNTKTILSIITILGVIIGSVLATIQIYEKVQPKKINLIQEYLFLSSSTNLINNRNKFLKNFSEEKQLAITFIQKITKQHETFNIVLNDVIISAFNKKLYNNIQSYFCSKLQLDEKEKKECSKQLIDHLRAPHIATYSLTNTNNFILKDIEIVFAKTLKNTKPILSFDDFLYESFVKDKYLYVKENKKISRLVKMPEEITVRIDYLRPGKTIIIPIYNWHGFYYDKNQDSQYDGYIYPYPMLYPLKVFVEGKEIINHPKKMSITPTFKLGEIETRG